MQQRTRSLAAITLVLFLLPWPSLLAADGLPAAPQADAPPAPLIPIASFASVPALTEPNLSPDGTVASLRMRRDGEEYVVIHHLFPKPGEEKKQPRAIRLGKSTLNWIDWANDRYLIASVRLTKKYMGEDIPLDRLMLIDREQPENLKFLGPEREALSADDVIYWAKDGSYILLNVGKSDFEFPRVYRVGIPDNSVTEVQKNKTGIFYWVANDRGEVVAGVGFTRTGKLQVIYREDPSKPYETVLKMKLDDDEEGSEDVYIANIDGETQKGYMVARRESDRWGLYEYDFRSKSFGAPVFTNDKVDLDDYDFDRDGKLRWVSYIDDRWRIKWFDQDAMGFYSELEKAIPDKMSFIASSSVDRKIRVIKTMAPTDPGTYYVYTEATGKMSFLAASNEPLRGQPLAPMEYRTFTARDGLEIPAYLTVPIGQKAERLPLVVMPHGGPFVRDEWEYDFMVQFLANRGYAVLQPNFRGSTGYGKKFEERGFAQFGKAMQDDVDDGVKWLVQSGIADPARVCIVGWSYGGYAAQVASFRNPDIYRCAVSIAGISDLEAMLKYDRRFMYGSKFRKWRARVQGDTSAKSLSAVSALSQIASIATPLLVVHGSDDDNVPVSQSDKLTKALGKAGKRYEYVRIEGGDHSLYDTGQRTQLLTALERFLAENNPSDALRRPVTATPAASPPSPSPP